MTPSFRRPSEKELRGKLAAARRLLEEGEWAPVRPEKLLPEFRELGAYTAEEMAAMLGDVLGEVLPEHYAGPRPPARAYEREIEGKELFGFCWESRRFRKLMYFRFAIVGETLYVSSLHVSKREEG